MSRLFRATTPPHWWRFVSIPMVPVVAACALADDIKEHKLQLAKPIAITEIQLVDPKMTFGRGGYQRLSARVRNRSRYTISEVGLTLTVLDCLRTTCDTVGEKKYRLVVAIPPAQARDIDEYIGLAAPAKPRGRLTWTYKVVYAKRQEEDW